VRRTLSILLAVVATFAIAGVAFAGNAHFIGTPSLSGATVNFKAAGLGNVDTATFTVTYDATVNSQCWTRSGNKPAADNKTDTFTGLETTATLPVRNGQTTGSITMTAPGSTLTCPAGQILRTSTVFSNVVLTGEGLIYEF
jgi:hypothetical protein